MKDILKKYKRPNKAKKRLTDFDFSKEGAHVALVNSAANGHEVLITKAEDEVLVALSMEQFLIRFFDMWRNDAAALAMIMGFDSEIYNNALRDAELWDDTWDKEAIERHLDSVMLIKAANEGVSLELISEAAELELRRTQQVFEKNLDRAELKMPLVDFLEYFFSQEESVQEDSVLAFENRANGRVAVTQEPFYEQRVNSMDFLKSLRDTKDFDGMSEEQKVLSKLFQITTEKNLLTEGYNPKQGDKPSVEDNNESDNEILKGEKMSDKDNAPEVTLEDVLKQLNDQAAVLKSLQAENDNLKAEKEAKLEEELVEKAKGFDFVTEDQAPVLGKLFKSLEGEQLDVLLDVLKAAKEGLDAKETEEDNADMFIQKSASGEGEGVDQPEDILKAKVNAALGIKEA